MSGKYRLHHDSDGVNASEDFSSFAFRLFTGCKDGIYN